MDFTTLNEFDCPTVNIANSECDLPTQFFLVELHTNDFVGESFVEQSVDFGSSRQLQCVDGRRARALDGTLKVLLKFLDTPEIGN